MQIAQTFQSEAAKLGYKAWIGLPDFTYSKVKDRGFDDHIESVMSKIMESGFEGDNWFLAAHSLGGYMTQDYLNSGSRKADPSQFKGQILMGNAILRSQRKI